MSSIKKLVESGHLSSFVPPQYVFQTSDDGDQCIFSEEEEQKIPIINFSMLTSSNSDQRSKAIQDIASACLEWGLFMVINHGVPETVREDMVKGSTGFFDMSEEEKREFAGNNLFDPIRCGTSFNVKLDKVLLWRDYLKVHVHPHFAAPHKPAGFSETLQEYTERTRALARELLKAISKSLGLEENYIIKAMEIDRGSELFVLNLYPPCPQPEVTMGLPPHTDHGLLTILLTNEVRGLQVQHNGKWVPINPLSNAFIVIIGDHMEILTNGIYKSAIHKAMVNNKTTRISIGTAHGPALDTVVKAAPELVDSENRPLLYRGITYREYLKLQQANTLDRKFCLQQIRI
ncbi:hypothetical protein ACFE04_025562 [Oxalis oulophora]